MTKKKLGSATPVGRRTGHVGAKPERHANRLRILPKTIRQLRAALTPRHDRGEPLALLWVRYASEDNRSVVVGVGMQPFPIEAYVDGPDGANFAVPWLMNALNEAANSNAGALLCHEHAHHGKPNFSETDRRTNDRVMSKQRLVNDAVPYGALVVSLDNFRALVAVASGFDEFEVKVPVAFQGPEET